MSRPHELAAGVHRVRPELLVGGAPLRTLRLSDTGRQALDALLTGAPHPGAETLRVRLQNAGMILTPPGPARTELVTVVIPVRGRPADVCLVVAGVPAGLPVVVVDDGSATPLADELARLHRPGMRLVRRETSGGPAVARNAGAACVTTDLIAFVDADVELPVGWLDRLTGHFADERVVAVAPRVVSRHAEGSVGILEQQLCALDLGAVPADVRPGAAVSYVPATVLVARRVAFNAIGGFDDALTVGEDVDLVWRLADRGVVRYDPSVVVRHGPRPTLLDALRRRFDYGLSAAQLDRRHPARLRHVFLSAWSALPWLAALAHPAAGVAAATGVVITAPSRLTALAPPEARRLTLLGLVASFGAVGRYAIRPAFPLTAAALLSSQRVRRLAPIVTAAYVAGSWSRLQPGPMFDLPVRSGLHVLDDLAYSTGVWFGALRWRRPGVLLPGLLPSFGRPAA